MKLGEHGSPAHSRQSRPRTAERPILKPYLKPSGAVANLEQKNNFTVRHCNPAPVSNPTPVIDTLGGQQKGQRSLWDQSPNNDATASLLTGQPATMASTTNCKARRPRQARTGLLHSEEKHRPENSTVNASLEICRSQHRDAPSA